MGVLDPEPDSWSTAAQGWEPESALAGPAVGRRGTGQNLESLIGGSDLEDDLSAFRSEWKNGIAVRALSKAGDGEKGGPKCGSEAIYDDPTRE